MNPEMSGWSGASRLILYHSQSTSARTLFLRHATGSVIAPEPLPASSRLVGQQGREADISPLFLHPASVVGHYCASCGLAASLLQADGEFHEQVATSGATLHVYLARFTSIDPPREWSAEQGGKFSAITELRGGSPVEMALLQRAYQTIMG